MDNRKELVEVFAVAFMLSLSLTFMWIFNTAYLNGGTTTVGIDWYNEAQLELFVFTMIVWPTISVGIYQWTR